MEQLYPTGIDSVWLATDRDGHVAVFVTAGNGPIPACVLSAENVAVEDIEGMLVGLPRVTTARLLISVKRPDDYLDMAERGLFVYDWTDAHRTASEALRTYELMAAPISPATVDAMPIEVVRVMCGVAFDDISFAKCK